ncbi:hypothetical protein BCR37DRAFT_377959 [Protomyces lactucae-debilis]|uniref:Uncharacterized protein n=1 Tax=Protomyces lactucae-debilis TaxID=2754530 RepID=A0A1Y2FM07_PROLT|nr:uncharacterized protein BCR37DRAFT_377959 [Protomyces lactucae-debilis]ORY84988.1 hypothetical protein BCR37DRAFT_377959 [Protomyces lactucae-debilis]
MTKIMLGTNGLVFYLSPDLSRATLTNRPFTDHIYRNSHECAMDQMAERLKPWTRGSIVWLKEASGPVLEQEHIQCQSSAKKCYCAKEKSVMRERQLRPWMCELHPGRVRIEQCPVIGSSQTHDTGQSQWLSSSNSQDQRRKSNRGKTKEFGNATLPQDPFPDFAETLDEMSEYFSVYQELCEASNPEGRSTSNPSSQPGANIGQCWPILPLDYGYFSAAYSGETSALASDPNARPAYDPSFFPTHDANTLTSAALDPNAGASSNPGTSSYPDYVRTAEDEAAFDDFYDRNNWPASWR